MDIDDDNNDAEANVPPPVSLSTAATNSISNLPALTAAFAAAATTGGTSYAFGLYATALKRRLSLTQGELDSISTAFFVAGLFSWIPGLVADRWGTQVAISVGGGCGAVVLLCYWAVATERIVVVHTMLVGVLSGLGIGIFLSCALVTGAVFKTIVALTGPGSRGSAVGAAKGYVGLGAGLYACLFGALQSESELDFLPMCAFFFIVCASLPAMFLLPSKEKFDQMTRGGRLRDDATPRHFNVLYVSLLTMGGVIVVSSMLDLYHTSKESSSVEAAHSLESVVDVSLPVTTTDAASANSTADGSQYSRALLLMVIWLGPIYALQYIPSIRKLGTMNSRDGLMRVPTSDDGNTECEVAVDSTNASGDTNIRNHNNKQDDSNVDAEEEEELLVGASNSGQRPTSTSDDQGALPDLTLVQMLQTPSAWLMLWTTTMLVGAGTVETNNMGQMVESLTFPPAVTSAALALFSVAQAMSRVLTGSLSEASIKYAPRPVYLVIASVLGFVSHGLLAVAKSEVVFVVGAALAGAAFGMVWPLMVLIVGEVFGPANVGANYMFYDGFTSAAGTLLLTKVIAQDVYESHIGPDAADRTTCVGLGCFQDTHMAVAGLSLTCVVSSWAMLFTTSHVYRSGSLRRSGH